MWRDVCQRLERAKESLLWYSGAREYYAFYAVLYQIDIPLLLLVWLALMLRPALLDAVSDTFMPFLINVYCAAMERWGDYSADHCLAFMLPWGRWSVWVAVSVAGPIALTTRMYIARRLVAWGEKEQRRV